MVDVNLGYLNLEVVGEEPDGFPHRAEAGTTRRLEERGGGRRAWGDRRSGGQTGSNNTTTSTVTETDRALPAAGSAPFYFFFNVERFLQVKTNLLIDKRHVNNNQ